MRIYVCTLLLRCKINWNCLLYWPCPVKSLLFSLWVHDRRDAPFLLVLKVFEGILKLWDCSGAKTQRTGPKTRRDTGGKNLGFSTETDRCHWTFLRPPKRCHGGWRYILCWAFKKKTSKCDSRAHSMKTPTQNQSFLQSLNLFYSIKQIMTTFTKHHFHSLTQ